MKCTYDTQGMADGEKCEKEAVYCLEWRYEMAPGWIVETKRLFCERHADKAYGALVSTRINPRTEAVV